VETAIVSTIHVRVRVAQRSEARREPAALSRALLAQQRVIADQNGPCGPVLFVRAISGLSADEQPYGAPLVNIRIDAEVVIPSRGLIPSHGLIHSHVSAGSELS
jgi:hypothetical protein